AVLCFTYDAAVSPDRLENFAVQADPTRWGLFAAGALLFHRRDVAPARDLVEVAYDDTALYTPGPFVSDLYRLGWRSRVRNAAAAAPADSSVSVRLPAVRRAQQIKSLTTETGEPRFGREADSGGGRAPGRTRRSTRRKAEKELTPLRSLSPCSPCLRCK